MERIIQAVAISFLHSLWQGIIIAGVAAAIILLARRTSSLFRYTILCILFVLFIFCFGYTFMQQLSGEYNLNTEINPAETGSSALILPHITENDWAGSISGWCSQNSYLIMGIWLAIFIFRTAVMMKSLMLIGRIRRNGGNEVSEFWKLKMYELTRLLKLRVSVSFRQSYVVTQPVIIGFFKPVIFFPVALLNNLSVADAETILLHELAHIKRRDSIVNFLQILFELVFFFNPALLWISAQIRKEREYCCDDIAIDKKGEKSFLEALVSFYEYQPVSEKYTLAFGGAKSLLRKRVNRIIQPKHVVSKINILVSIFCILGAIAFISTNTFSRTAIKNPKQDTTTGLSITTSNDSIPRQPFNAGGTKEKNADSKGVLPTTQRETKKIQPFIRDTIPINASKEFIAGYRAGMAYKEGRSKTEDEKAIIERQLIASDVAIQKTGDNMKKTLDHPDRIEMEKAAKLRAEQKLTH